MPSIGPLKQLALRLLGGKAGTNAARVDAAEYLTKRGPRGEYYAFPKEDNFQGSERNLYEWLRTLVDEGQLKPVREMDVSSVKASEAARAQRGSHLANRAVQFGFPRSDRTYGPEFEALALKLSDDGRRADALAALNGPKYTNDSRSMFLHDLTAVDRPGSGGSLLRSILEGPLFPDASKMLLTPIDDAMPFYKKFGMEYVSPKEAASDPTIMKILDSLGESHNADLGVGVIRRAKGGLATTRNAA